jgi:hypothetical protein
MKKSILLFAACLVAGFTQAQNARTSVLFSDANRAGNFAASFDGGHDFTNNTSLAPAASTTDLSLSGARTTTTYTRWYSYFDSIQVLAPSTIDVGFIGMDLWNDISSTWGYTTSTGSPEYSKDSFTSLGLSFNPMYSAWNDATTFPGQMAIRPTDAYTIDGAKVLGWYNRSYATPAKIAVMDTLILTFIQGNGSAGSNNMIGTYSGTSSVPPRYGVVTLSFLQLFHDSINNRAGNIIGASPSYTVTPVPTTQVYKFILNSSDTNNSNSGSGTTFPRPGHVPADPAINFAVSAGNYAAMSVSFKSGDITYVPGDTIRLINSGGTAVSGFKYGGFREEVGYRATSGGTSPPADWAYYASGDLVSGFFKKETAGGWGGSYIQNWAWSAGTPAGPSELQYPLIDFHVSCATCVLTGTPSLGINQVTDLGKVTVTPNPANDQLNISFTAQGSASVTLTNAIGQVVAAQTVTNGKASFNTTAIPAGVYIYSVKANGESATGRVVVAH